MQLIGVVGWLIVDAPTTKEVHPYRLSAVLTCGISNVSLILSLGYNMVLILLCTVYAFKTRKIPENFNEAKYIGFTMYSTCIVWLAFVPIYFGTNNDYKVSQKRREWRGSKRRIRISRRRRRKRKMKRMRRGPSWHLKRVELAFSGGRVCVFQMGQRSRWLDDSYTL